MKLMRRFRSQAGGIGVGGGVGGVFSGIGSGEYWRDRRVFGVPLTVVQRRSGQPLPQCILAAMRCLRRTARGALGIFRKSGVKSRIQKLRSLVELDPGWCTQAGSNRANGRDRNPMVIWIVIRLMVRIIVGLCNQVMFALVIEFVIGILGQISYFISI